MQVVSSEINDMNHPDVPLGTTRIGTPNGHEQNNEQDSQ
jgi:hypothetical protein